MKGKKDKVAQELYNKFSEKGFKIKVFKKVAQDKVEYIRDESERRRAKRLQKGAEVL